MKITKCRVAAAIGICVAVAGLFGCGEQNTSKVSVAPPVAKIASATSETKSAKAATHDGAKSADGKSIAWATSFEAARAQAKAQNKVLMIDFYTDWCGACKMLDEKIFPNADVVEASRKFVNVKVNAEQRTDIANQYGVTAFPTLIWIRADGVPVLRQDGASEEASHFVTQMHSAHSRYAALEK